MLAIQFVVRPLLSNEPYVYSKSKYDRFTALHIKDQSNLVKSEIAGRCYRLSCGSCECYAASWWII